jgi:hypothetical protein
VAPVDPVLASTSHTVGVPSTDRTVDVSFSSAPDSPAGVDGFSYEWSASPGTLPDATKDAEENADGTTSATLADGSHWFHLRTVDNAGNWSATAHLGPFVIVTPSPTPPAAQPPPAQPVPPAVGGVAKKKCKKGFKLKKGKCVKKKGRR